MTLSSPRAPLLSVRGLTVEVPSAGAYRAAVDGIDFDLAAGESLAIAGESGCGKTLLARALIGLLPAAARCSGQVILDGRNLVPIPDREWESIRGRRIGFLFQEPGAAFDPVRTIGQHLVEAIRLHGRATRREAREQAEERLQEVSFENPGRGFEEYPHRLSGGQKQRAMLAVALAADPEILIADEPTTALDTTIAAQVLDLLARLRQKRGLTLLLISHDLAMLEARTDRALVLYAGRIIEEGSSARVFRSARHPYTRGLLRSLPLLAPDARPGRLFEAIAGAVPDLSARPSSGCAFAPRCPERFDPCEHAVPLLMEADGTRARCFLYGGAAAMPVLRSPE